MIARIATDSALDRTFDYRVPCDLQDRVTPGVRVRVPFGRRTIEGTVVELADSSEHPSLKAVEEVLGERPLLLPGLVELARWMGRYYMAPIETVLRSMTPSAVRRAECSPVRKRWAVEIVPCAERPSPAPELTERQREILARLERVGGGLLSGLCRQWKVSQGVVQKLADAGQIRLVERAPMRNPLAGRTILASQPLPLSPAQARALEVVEDALRQRHPRPVLLYGVTASGKTEVYLQAIASVLAGGRGAIALVPEISLTPQTIQRFASRFGERVAVLHSQLSDGERHDEWHRIRRSEARVVIGPRSAVFAPVENLGILIVDEEHEPSYKQEDAPRYHGRDVAVMRGHLEGCTVVLGSATPSCESWHNARLGKYALCEMNERVPGASPPAVTVVNLRPGLAPDEAPRVFSETLVDAVRRRLELGEQTMLFLNRRGYAPSLRCPACGQVEACEDCARAMTYHLHDDVLRCHLCGVYRNPPERCTACGQPGIRRQGIGTQRVESIARTLFPGARIERMDADVTSCKWSHDEILARFRAGRINILIGTQMIAKGLDFPNVTLVGILNADAGLFIPDFRAAERTFQLLAQMSGRSGRGAVQGDVLIQTSAPTHPAIDCARTEDFHRFVEQELNDREEWEFPPFSRVACVTFRGPDLEPLRDYAERFVGAIGDGGGRFRHGGALPAPIARVKGQHRYQWVVRTRALTALRAHLRERLSAMPPPRGMRVAVDVDAINLL